MRKSASCWSLSPAAPDLHCWASRWGCTQVELSPFSSSFLLLRLCATCVLRYWHLFQAQQEGVLLLNGLVMKILRLITALKMIIFKLGDDKTQPTWWGLISTSAVVLQFMTFLCLQASVCGLGRRSWLDKYFYSERGRRLNFWMFALCVTWQKAAVSCQMNIQGTRIPINSKHFSGVLNHNF